MASVLGLCILNLCQDVLVPSQYQPASPCPASLSDFYVFSLTGYNLSALSSAFRNEINFLELYVKGGGLGSDMSFETVPCTLRYIPLIRVPGRLHKPLESQGVRILSLDHIGEPCPFEEVTGNFASW